MNYRAIIRRLDGSTQKFDVCDADDLNDAFTVLKRDVPNARVTLIAISGGQNKKRKVA